MWLHEHDRRTEALVNALADDVARALSVGYASVPTALYALTSAQSRLGPDIFPAFASAARSSLKKALAGLASSINEQSPINRLPPELLCCIARFLPFPTLVSSNAVCRQWRLALQNDIKLWTCLEVHLDDTPARWASTMGPLLARSGLFPLRLSLSFGCGVHLQALLSCLKLVVSHLDHIVELSIGVPLAVAHDCLWALVEAPAPMLEVFRFLCEDQGRRSDFIKYMPPALFSGHAPRLHTLYSRRATLPPLCAPAFSRLKQITYDNSPISMELSTLLMTLQSCPALDTLVLVAGCIPDAITPTVPPRIPSLATLLVSDNDTSGTDALLALFPAAVPATVLSFAQLSLAPWRMLSHLQAATPIRDLDLCVRPLGLARASPFQEVHYAMSINCTLTFVDLNRLLVHDLFSLKHLFTFSVHTVERLALPLPLADVLPLLWARLTGLRELVLTADPDWGAAWPAVLRRAAIPLETLRFVVLADQVWSAAARAVWTFQVCPIVRTLTTAIGGRIRKLVLPGFPALANADLPDLVDEIVLESPSPPPTEPGFESWFWDFDEDAALHV